MLYALFSICKVYKDGTIKQNLVLTQRERDSFHLFYPKGGSELTRPPCNGAATINRQSRELYKPTAPSIHMKLQMQLQVICRGLGYTIRFIPAPPFTALCIYVEYLGVETGWTNRTGPNRAGPQKASG